MAGTDPPPTSPRSSTRSNQTSCESTEDFIKAITKPQSNIISIQLDESNYLLWKLQVETAAKGYGLEDYLYGTKTIPAKFNRDKDNNLVVNQEFTTYQRQDNLVSAWLMSTVGPSLMPQLIGIKNAHDIWTALERSFTSQSSARVLHYKKQLQSIKKGNSSMNDYLMKVKNLCDQLACTGNRIEEREQVLYIVGGLEDEYESVIAFITSIEPTPSLQSVYSMLLAHEGRFLGKKDQETDASVNYTTTGKEKNQQTNNTRGQNSYQRGGQSGRGRGRAGRWNSNNRPKCQICDKIGHTANRCYFRFNNNFNVNQQSSNNNRNNNPNVNMVNSQADSKNSQDSTSNVATIDDIQDDAWYPDSGATHHVTNSLSNLNLGNREYKG